MDDLDKDGKSVVFVAAEEDHTEVLQVGSIVCHNEREAVCTSLASVYYNCSSCRHNIVYVMFVCGCSFIVCRHVWVLQ